MTAAALLDEAQAAEVLGITARQLRDMRYRRQIRFVRVGRLVRFRPEHLEAYIARNTENVA